MYPTHAIRHLTGRIEKISSIRVGARHRIFGRQFDWFIDWYSIEWDSALAHTDKKKKPSKGYRDSRINIALYVTLQTKQLTETRSRGEITHFTTVIT